MKYSYKPYEEREVKGAKKAYALWGTPADCTHMALYYFFRDQIDLVVSGINKGPNISTDIIYSDLIPMGEADVIISMEPMEALRYLPYLSKDGAVVTSSQSFVNIPNYPDSSAIDAELAKLPKVAKLDIEQIAKEVATVRSANVVLLGMAAPYIGILSTDELRSAVARVFQRKGEAIVEANLKTFDAGVAAVV